MSKKSPSHPRGNFWLCYACFKDVRHPSRAEGGRFWKKYWPGGGDFAQNFGPTPHKSPPPGQIFVIFKKQNYPGGVKHATIVKSGQNKNTIFSKNVKILPGGGGEDFCRNFGPGVGILSKFLASLHPNPQQPGGADIFEARIIVA